MFVSRVAVSLRIPGLEKKSIVKITSPVHNCRMVEVYMPAILFCCIEEVRSLLELRQLSILRRICSCLCYGSPHYRYPYTYACAYVVVDKRTYFSGDNKGMDKLMFVKCMS